MMPNIYSRAICKTQYKKVYIKNRLAGAYCIKLLPEKISGYFHRSLCSGQIKV